MSRLIDADELKERFCEENCGKNRCVDHMDKCAWILSVEESKTAFDVDKVVEQLKQLKMRCFLTIANTGDADKDCAYKNIANTIDRAIEIIKGGGVEWVD